MICRLCSGPTVEQFRHMVLGKYDVGYHECQTCASLQTDDPYWLDEAYAGVGTGFDTGAVQRSIDTALTMHAVLDLIGWDKAAVCLDYGAGEGLFARMMRDRGYDFRVADAYTRCFYADRFKYAGPAKLVTSFEVFEHLTNPGKTLEKLLSGMQPDFLFFSTELNLNQGAEWSYINPRQGQHVFFYSENGLRAFGKDHGYRFGSAFGFLAFVKEGLGFPLVGEQEFYQRRERLWQDHQRNPYQHAARDNAMLLGMK